LTQIYVTTRNHLFALFSHENIGFLKQIFELGHQPVYLETCGGDIGGNLIFGNLKLLLFEEVPPRIDDWLPSQLVAVDVHHSAPTDGCGTGHRQILHFKEHQERLGEFDSLSVGETEHFVIVQNGVQVLDPDGVNGAVEH